MPENTTKSLSMGGTGVALRDDPSAFYFNPALLSHSNGLQVLADVNATKLNTSFKPSGNNSSKTARNKASWTPIPFIASSWDLGSEHLGAGIGVFAPHSSGQQCYGQMKGTECEPDPDNPARFMLVESDSIELFTGAGLAARFELLGGEVAVGFSMLAAYQNLGVTTYVSTDTPITPGAEAVLQTRDVSSWQYTGISGLSYKSEPISFGVSYRPPLTWNSRGKYSIDFPKALSGLGPYLTDNRITSRFSQAGRLRIGVGYEKGEHPGDEQRPQLELEMDGVWENWSSVKGVELAPQGDLAFQNIEGSQSNFPLGSASQSKNFNDALSLRFGASYAPYAWGTAQVGTFFETATQPQSQTHMQLLSWDRFGASLGSTFTVTDSIDLELAYAHVYQPDRTVQNGKVHAPVPTSPCEGPQYINAECENPGTPPGEVVNNGNWSANVNVMSAGMRLQF